MNGAEELLLGRNHEALLLGVEREDDEVGVGAADELLDGLAEGFGWNLWEDLLHELILHLDAGNRFVVEERAVVLAGVGDAALFVAVVEELLHGGEAVEHGAVDLALGEAELIYAIYFFHNGLDSFLNAAFLRNDLDVECACDLR